MVSRKGAAFVVVNVKIRCLGDLEKLNYFLFDIALRVRLLSCVLVCTNSSFCTSFCFLLLLFGSI